MAWPTPWRNRSRPSRYTASLMEKSGAAGRLRFLSRFRRALQIVLRWRTLFGQAALPLFILLLFLRQRLLTFFVPIIWCSQFEIFSIHRSGFKLFPRRSRHPGCEPFHGERERCPRLRRCLAPRSIRLSSAAGQPLGASRPWPGHGFTTGSRLWAFSPPRC